MATKNNDEFDVLTFFIIVMVVLTVIVALFAYVLKNRVAGESKKITREINNLRSLQELAQDKKFKNWIQREREGRTEGGASVEFDARLEQSSNRFGVTLDRLDRKGIIPGQGFRELPFNLTIKKTKLKPLILFLFDVEEKWIGAKVKQMQMNWREKNKAWSCDVTVSVFKSNTQSD